MGCWKYKPVPGYSAAIARLAVNARGHLSYDHADPALPHGLVEASRLTHAASIA